MRSPAASLRKWLALGLAVGVYYIVHEGAHCAVAGCYGTLEGVRLLGLGLQTVVDGQALSNEQLGIFCLAGSAATLTVGWLLCWRREWLCRRKSRLARAVGYYSTVVLLLVDPLYLTVLYKFCGGGDMNGLRLLGLPEPAWQLLFLLVGLANLVLIRRLVYPGYKQAFR